MSIIIYQMAHSPFCIPVTAALASLGVEHETREVPNWDRRAILELTGGAYYQVPVLVHDDRLVFESAADSQDVARHVDHAWAGGRLFPAALDGLQAIALAFIENEIEARTFKLTDVHYLAALVDIGIRGMIVRHKERRFGRGCVQQWQRDATAIRAEADALLARFETTLRHTPFIFGESPVYSDFALFGILGNLCWNDWNRLSKEQDALAQWRARMAAWRFPTA
jgi:glutathione S-transferase